MTGTTTTAPVYGVRRTSDGEIVFSSTDGEVAASFAEIQGEGYEVVTLVADDRGERPTAPAVAPRFMLDCGERAGVVTSASEIDPTRVFVRCESCGQTESQPVVQGVTYARPGASHIFRWVDEARTGEIVLRDDTDRADAERVVEAAEIHARATGSVGTVYTDDRSRVGGTIVRGAVGDVTLPGRDKGGNWNGFGRENADREKLELAIEDVSALRERLARYRRRTIVLADAVAAAVRDDRLFDAQRELDAAKETAAATLRILEVLRRVEDGEL